jgi:hypothetical protein
MVVARAVVFSTEIIVVMGRKAVVELVGTLGTLK